MAGHPQFCNRLSLTRRTITQVVQTNEPASTEESVLIPPTRPHLGQGATMAPCLFPPTGPHMDNPCLRPPHYVIRHLELTHPTAPLFSPTYERQDITSNEESPPRDNKNQSRLLLAGFTTQTYETWPPPRSMHFDPSYKASLAAGALMILGLLSRLLFSQPFIPIVSASARKRSSAPEIQVPNSSSSQTFSSQVPNSSSSQTFSSQATNRACTCARAPTVRPSSDNHTNPSNTSPGYCTLSKNPFQHMSMASTNLHPLPPMPKTLTTKLIPTLIPKLILSLLLHTNKNNNLPLPSQDKLQSTLSLLMLSTAIYYTPNNATQISPNMDLLPIPPIQFNQSEYPMLLLPMASIIVVFLAHRKHLPLPDSQTSNEVNHHVTLYAATTKHATNYYSTLRPTCSYLSALCPEHAHANVYSRLNWRLPPPHC